MLLFCITAAKFVWVKIFLQAFVPSFQLALVNIICRFCPAQKQTAQASSLNLTVLTALVLWQLTTYSPITLKRSECTACGGKIDLQCGQKNRLAGSILPLHCQQSPRLEAALLAKL